MNRMTKCLLLPLAAACCVLRVWQLCADTEPDTGFLSVFGWKGWAFWLLAVLGSLVLVAVNFRAKLRPQPLGARPAAARGVAAAVVAIAICAEAGLSVGTALADGFQFNVWHIVIACVGLLAALTLVILAVQLLRGKPARIFAPLTLLPGGWLAARALIAYLEARAVVTVPQLLLEILTTLALAVCWLAHARIHSNVESQKGQHLLDMARPVMLILVVSTVLPAVLGALAVGTAVSPVSFALATDALMAAYFVLLPAPVAAEDAVDAADEDAEE